MHDTGKEADLEEQAEAFRAKNHELVAKNRALFDKLKRLRYQMQDIEGSNILSTNPDFADDGSSLRVEQASDDLFVAASMRDDVAQS